MLKSAQRSNGTLEVYYKIMMITLVSESVREMVAYRGVTLLKMRRRKDLAKGTILKHSADGINGI